MSSFVVSNKCMNNVINGIYWNTTFKTYYGHSLKERYKSLDNKAMMQIASDLFNLNYEATSYRYKSSDHINIDRPIFEWDMYSGHNIFQVVKSIKCLLYQCSEGSFMKDDRFKFLETLERQFTNIALESVKEYQDAEWN